jgi:hypothetical protein
MEIGKLLISSNFIKLDYKIIVKYRDKIVISINIKYKYVYPII